MKKQYTYDRHDEPAVISKALSDLLLSREKPAELMALYWFYYYTAKWQDTNQAKATNGYVATALKWSIGRVIRTGRELEELGLIRKMTSRDPDTNKINGHYVRVCFRWSEYKNPTVWETHSVENLYINASKTNNKNKKGFDPLELPDNLSRDDKVRAAWAEFIQHRKEKKCPITPLSWKKLIREMSEQEPEVVCAAIDKAIANGWRGLFFNTPASETREERRTVCKPAATPNGNRLLQFLKCTDNYASGLVADSLADEVDKAYKLFSRVRNPDRPDQGPMDHFNQRSFFAAWMEWLQERQERFPIRSWRDLSVGGYRWREFIKDLERKTGYYFKTGRRRE